MLTLAALAAVVGCTSGSIGHGEAIDAALAHVDVTGDDLETDVRSGEGGVVDVLIVRDISGQDDSVRAIRHVVTVDDDEPPRVVDSLVEQACQEGRGHEGFSDVPCR